MSSQHPSLLGRVATAAAREPLVRFIYVFGSVATGTAHPDSDLDLAISTSAALLPDQEAALHGDLEEAAGRPVDLLLLDRAALWLSYRVLGEGRVVFSRDEPGRIAFRARVEQEFLDFRHLHDAYLAATRDRARRGALSGG